jgi:hypothetical protein
MSRLIDVIVRDQVKHPVYAEFAGKWFWAKPMEIRSFWGRLKDALRVLTGKSRAYHYRRDK